ncbi:MAG: hypothetical protein QM496_02090 [Verrucomicrobiota bacterium]
MKLNLFCIVTILLSVFTTPLTAQDKAINSTEEKISTSIKKKDVFIKNTQDKTDFEGITPDIGILVEYISLDHQAASELLRKFTPKAADVTELRDELEQMIDNKKANLLETTWLWSRSGQRAKTESVREAIYATEYTPPEMPKNIDPPVISDPAENEASSNSDIQLISSMPTAWEMRNVGTTLECDPVLSSDHKLISISLAPEIVTQLEDRYFTREDFEKTAYGVEHISMPTFYAIKDTVQIEVTPGKYNLLGIHTPNDDTSKRILVLLRADLISFE